MTSEKGISLAIHHGGHFQLLPLVYKEGKVSYVNYYDEDKLTYVELKAIIDERIEKPSYKIYYKPPEDETDLVMRRVTSDKDVLGLLGCRRDLGPIEVYVMDKESFEYSKASCPNPYGAEYVEDGDENDDNQSVASLDHISEGEEELLEVRSTALLKKEKAKNNETCKEFGEPDNEDIKDGEDSDEEEKMSEGDASGAGCEGHNADRECGEVDRGSVGPNEANDCKVEEDDGPGPSTEDIGPQKKPNKQKKHHRKPSDNSNPTDASSPYVHDPRLTELCEEYDASKFVDPEIESDDDRRIPLVDSEDEKDVDINEKWPIHNPTTHWKKLKPYNGERYESIEQLKHCLQCYAVANGRNIHNKKSDKQRLQVRCVTGCPWRLHASWMQDGFVFQVKSLLDKHTCVQEWSSRMINHDWLAIRFGRRIRQQPNWSLLDFRDEVLEKYRIKVTTFKCYRARKKILDEVEDTMKENYALLWNYTRELIRSNPGSTVRMEVNRPTEQSQAIFKRLYVCLKAVKQGFVQGCRKIIGLDGCFLKTVCKGQLLAAVGKDANNHIYPVAWAVVQTENYESWSWFLGLLHDDIDMDAGHEWTIMNDGQKGLISAVNYHFPYAEQRRCARHIYVGLRKKSNSVVIRNLFWDAAKSTTPEGFEKVMNEIKKENKGCYDYLMHKDRDPKTWSKAFFGFDSKVANRENNVCECFNSFILDARRKPIITRLEEIRVTVMERMNKMRAMSSRMDDLDGLLKVQRKILEKNKAEMRFWKARHNSERQFEVRDRDLHGFTVDLATSTCTCREWMLTGIPCIHACSAIMSINDKPERFVSKYYFKDCFDKTYEMVLKPVNGVDLWPKTGVEPVLPPLKRRGRGRPKYLRRREEEEDGKGNDKVKDKVQSTRYAHAIPKSGRQMRCQNCQQVGHNSRGCKNEHVVVEPKVPGKPGRPKKGTDPTSDDPATASRPTPVPKRRRMANAEPSTRTPPVSQSTPAQTQQEENPFPPDTQKMHLGYGVLYDEISGKYYIGTEHGDPLSLSRFMSGRDSSSQSQVVQPQDKDGVFTHASQSSQPVAQSQPMPKVTKLVQEHTTTIAQSQPELRSVFSKPKTVPKDTRVNSPSRRSQRILRTRAGRSIPPHEPGGSPSNAISITFDDPDEDEYREELRRKATKGKGKKQ